MTLVHVGSNIWINPEHVVAVFPQDGKVRIDLVTDNSFIRVDGTLSNIVHALNGDY